MTPLTRIQEDHSRRSDLDDYRYLKPLYNDHIKVRQKVSDGMGGSTAKKANFTKESSWRERVHVHVRRANSPRCGFAA
ncbi:hypothetical protein F2Q70_00034818 [Brassica cretica]|uniref:Uncharacterized protein n=1 Tax=Brassica cretica TaxID=69181 RepID=A0A8S9JZ38_BRACR|nr:hypothetical protein F2Q70_00034818 [Brassica cretica]